MDVAIQWILFIGLSGIGVIAAGAMLLTLSMVRAGLALMSSFVALAGLFVLLDADLLAAIQIMMNVGGMLVMILFMVMAMMDPGGEMMGDMKRKMHLRGPGALSMRMPTEAPLPAIQPADDHAGHHQMMMDMAMSTPQLPWALAVGVATAAVLGIVAMRTPWPLAGAIPTQDATNAVGELLLSRYMIAFEGAALLILAGIAGAVIFGKRERPPGVATASEVMSSPQHASGAGAAFTCPMHPEVRATAPGKCPKCGMALVRATDANATARGSR